MSNNRTVIKKSGFGDMMARPPSNTSSASGKSMVCFCKHLKYVVKSREWKLFIHALSS